MPSRTKRLMFLPAAFVLTIATGCSDPAALEVRTAFDSFQRAVFAADRPALRRLLTHQSHPAIEHLPFARIRTQEPLTVVEVERRNSGRYDVRVFDPTNPGRPGTYAVMREYGSGRIDLVESAALNNPIGTDPNPELRIVPAEHDARGFAEFQAARARSIR